MENKEKTGTLAALGLAFQLGYTIAIPAVAFALIGRLLDKKYGTSPFLLIGGLFLALIISSIVVFRKANAIMKDITKDDKANKKDVDNNPHNGTNNNL